MAEFKGFAGGVAGGRALPPQSKDCFAGGVFALFCGRVAEAYLCFRECDQNQCAVQFNMALCFYRSEDYEKALSYLDSALRLLPALPSGTAAVPEALESYEARNDGYKAPMPQDAPRRYPERCRISILRLKADLLYAMGDIRELNKLLPALSGRNYKNIEQIKEACDKEE